MLDTEGAPALEVGFIIDPGGSFDELAQLQRVMNSTEAKILRDAAQIERATGGMVNVAGAAARLTAFGNAASRELQTVTRETALAEKAGERLVAQLERENSAFGRNRGELRLMKAEMMAARAEQSGLTELAARIRGAESELAGRELMAARKARFEAETLAEQRAEAEAAAAAAALRERALAEQAVIVQLRERNQLEAALARNTGVGRAKATDSGATFSALAARAAEDEARAVALATSARTAEAAAIERAAREHAQLAAAVQGSRAAQLADAAAAEQMRRATDPLYAATARLNAQISESTRLYQTGATAPAEYARQQSILAERLRDVERQHDLVAVSQARTRGSMMQLGMQINDVATMAALGAPPFQILASQIGQIIQVAQMAEGGVRGFGKEVGALALRFAPLIAVGAGATYMLKQYTDKINEGANTQAFLGSLNLTKDEMKKVGNTAVSMGDVLLGTFDVIGKGIWNAIGPAVTDANTSFEKWFWESDRRGRESVNNLIGYFVGGFNAIKAVWGQLPSAMADLFIQAVNGGIMGLNKLIAAAVAGTNGFIAQANRILPDNMDIAPLVAPQIASVENAHAGAAKRVGDTWRGELAKAQRDYLGGFGKAIGEAAIQRRNQRVIGSLDRDDKGAKKASPTAARLSDEEKAYQAAIKAAEAYISAQEKEAARIGKNAKELRLMEDAVQRAAAPIEEQKKRIDAVAAKRETAFAGQAMKDFEANVLQPLRDELALYDLVGPARERAALGLEKEGFMAKQVSVDLATAEAMWQRYYAAKSAVIDRNEAADNEQAAIRRMTDEIAFAADKWDILASNVQTAATGMADAFGAAGRAIGDVAAIYAGFQANRARMDAQHAAAIAEAGKDQRKIERENVKFAMASGTAQIGLYGDMAAAAKGFFDEKSAGYQALAAAEKVFRAVEFAMSVRAMAQDVSETISSVTNSAARATAAGAEGVAQQAKLPFPANIAAMAATGAALVAAGVALLGSGGGASQSAPTNTGTGTVFGDPTAKSESIRNAIEALKDVDTLTNTYARQMASSLRSIENQIGGLASLVVRAGGDIGAPGVTEGFKPNFIGSVLGKIPLIGGFLRSLFGSTTTITGSGITAGPQSLGSILGGGFNAQYFTDLQKKSKFLGITTGTKNSTQYSSADAGLTSQFALLLRSFNDAIVAAAGPLGATTQEIQNRLNGFVVNIGKIDLKGLSGQEIQDKLSAVFGAAADQMAAAAFPVVAQFQKVGEGTFETLVRVASTLEQVGNTLDLLGQSAQGMGMAAKLGLADQFDSISDLTSAAESYFQAFYSKEEQAAAKTAQLARVFDSLGLTMPGSLAAFRGLVEAQDLATAAGQATYATLLKLAPAFADLQASLEGAKSAADIASERTDLQRQILQLQGNTAALRAMDLAKIDVSNRALQEQVWAIQDAQEAAKAADDLRQAWQGVGTSIMDEVKRIRGLSDAGGPAGFSALLGRFNAASLAARGGDIDAAKSLPQLSQALLTAAQQSATSRQELLRVQQQTAASLEATYGIVGALGATAAATTAAAQVTAASVAQAVMQPTNDNHAAVTEMRGALDTLRSELAQMRADNNAGHAANASNTGAIKRKLDDITAASGGDAISTVAAA